MQQLEASGPNAEQIAYWNEKAGPTWVAREALLDEQIAPLGLAAMDRAKVAAGERVLDVGCGCGQTTLELAARVGPRGAVTGIDISTPMLERARARAAERGVTDIRFLNADAQSTKLGPAISKPDPLLWIGVLQALARPRSRAGIVTSRR